MGTSWGQRSRGDGACVGMWRFGVLIPLLGAVGALQVSQEPAKLRVAAGTNVSLWCQLVTTEPWSLARISWLKDGDHEVLCTTRLYPKAAAVPCATPRLHLAWSPPYANLSLHGAQEGDAGSYVCCFAIEKPYLAMAAGNGTLLNVSTGADGVHGAEQKWKLWGAVGGTLLLVGLISFGCWRCRRRTDTSDIYVNVTLRRTPRNKSPQGAAAGGQRVQGGLGRAWKPPSPKG
ncbi:uncharacterized protein LOC116236146 isoform X2 [Phasianus colchicus]|uniref:uncharacterized protein LOC116236146 isoform X2 n=1 Tax=Phasianus colchicus TaxID=9054 RepID=UPI00129E2735|nr:uncharacterized protein LOC116236146 isoform X2 [Phasianus colchicus]